jgi:hypothetical protein
MKTCAYVLNFAYKKMFVKIYMPCEWSLSKTLFNYIIGSNDDIDIGNFFTKISMSIFQLSITINNFILSIHGFNLFQNLLKNISWLRKNN